MKNSPFNLLYSLGETMKSCASLCRFVTSGSHCNEQKLKHHRTVWNMKHQIIFVKKKTNKQKTLQAIILKVFVMENQYFKRTVVTGVQFWKVPFTAFTTTTRAHPAMQCWPGLSHWDQQGGLSHLPSVLSASCKADTIFLVCSASIFQLQKLNYCMLQLYLNYCALMQFDS